VKTLVIDPYPEWFHISDNSANKINRVKASGGRIIAVGTTVLRALESATKKNLVAPYKGYTELYVQAHTPLNITDGLLTGWHEPEASHLEMLAAIAPKKHLELTYEVAIRNQYYWHEFGDLHLLLKDN